MYKILGDDKKSITFQMTQELYERISKQAKKEEKKLNYLIREIIKDYLEYVDIKKGE